MKVIGLTGGIGSGKSTAAQYLKSLGATVIDLDKVGHEILKKDGPVFKDILSIFGDNILADNGEIDRTKLGKIVFGNPGALKKLNDITHPAIDKRVDDIMNQSNRRGIKVVVLEAAAMLEAGRSWQADEIWVVAAPETAVIDRIKNRPDYTEEIARTRIQSQMKNEERIKKADIAIINNGALEELQAEVKTEWEKLQRRLK
jgi:dephospho-CoA kinase